MQQLYIDLIANANLPSLQRDSTMINELKAVAMCDSHSSEADKALNLMILPTTMMQGDSCSVCRSSETFAIMDVHTCCCSVPADLMTATEVLGSQEAATRHCMTSLKALPAINRTRVSSCAYFAQLILCGACAVNTV